MANQPQGPTRRRSLRGIARKHCSEPHAGLWLDRFIVEQDKRNKEARKTLVLEVAGISAPDCYQDVYKRWFETLESFAHAGYAILRVKAEVTGRIVLGIGNEGVLETAVTLHRTYGVPYIPGSALKGLAANFARQYCGSDWKKESANYNVVFGDTEGSGCVVFFDAFLVAERSGSENTWRNPLHRDVLTPHHSGYYSGKKDTDGKLLPPADWDDPNPVHFLSATGTYLMAIAASSGGEGWLEAVMEILKNALKELGIGAKTSSGYGRMVFRSE